MKINVVWLRRDLRLEDNTAFNHAISSGLPVLLVFIFDNNIIDELPSEDPRISFIYESLSSIDQTLQKSGSSLMTKKGDPAEIWNELIVSFDINAVYINKDYEPYAIDRDNKIEALLRRKQIKLFRYKDQVIFEEKEILKSDNCPYTIFTPYRNKWLQKYSNDLLFDSASVSQVNPNYHKYRSAFPSIEEIGFINSSKTVRDYDLSVIKTYDKLRDIPSIDKTSYLGPHLRFGTISIRRVVSLAIEENAVFLNELIWREFFMQILFNFPDVVTGNFKIKYDNVPWRNNEVEFEMWCNGQTGFPIIDAGMRQLNNSGYMHNRVRMIAAGFLCKHLLIDWRWGEAYFAGRLLDYELASNNGNWQWASGTGCDAAPYFRVFNPHSQQKKFDPHKEYIRRWVDDFNKPTYPEEMVDLDFARLRAISAYKSGLSNDRSSPL